LEFVINEHENKETHIVPNDIFILCGFTETLTLSPGPAFYVSSVQWKQI